MKWIPTAVALAATCALLVGCGGGGGSTSYFRGNYQGTFTSNNSSDFGTITMAVDGNGDVRGTLVNNGVSPASRQTITGNIKDNGDIAGELQSSSANYPYSGNLGFDNTGALTGPIDIRTSPTDIVQATFNLTDVTGAKKYGSRVKPTAIGHAGTGPALLK